MTKFNVVRTGLLGSAAAFALIGAANAVEAEFGDVQITLDTTVSVGASMLTEDRNNQFLGEANGGPIDPRNNAALGGVNLGNGTVLNPLTFPAPASIGVGYSGLGSAVAPAGANAYSGNLRNNFDGTLNADDGRLNFDKGDLIGANVKANHDLQITWQYYKIFARAVGFYDVIMNDEDAGSRSKLTDDALGDVGRNYELLDAFISADYTLGDIPLNLRAGKQVINWGESTFILNGVNTFNPIDVAAFRRPGSEIKEALVPVNAVYGSVSLPANISLAAYYALDWQPFELDPSGTPFSTADSIAYGTGVGGNSVNGAPVSFVTSSPYSGNRRFCGAPAGTGTALVQSAGGLLPNPNIVPVPNNNRLECGENLLSPGVSLVDFRTAIPIGQHELYRLGVLAGEGGRPNLSTEGVSAGTTGILLRGRDHEASDDGQYGLKLALFAEDLGGTEFNFYYQNYHSRLPFVNIEASPTDTAADLGYFVNSFVSNFLISDAAGTLQSRQLNNGGCGLTSPALIGSIAGAAGLTINGTLSSPLTLDLPTTAGSAAAQMANTPVQDPSGILAAAAASGLLGAVSMYVNPNPAIGIRNQLAVAQLNCALTYYQSGFVLPPGAIPPGGITIQSFDGAEFLLSASDGTVALQYPENIKSYGFSFNTTISGWGVQGEISYRPEAPFQVDTDSLTIASLVNGCTFTQLYGAAGVSLGALANNDGSGVRPRCGNETAVANGVIYNEMITAQVGTTATFTGSDWFVDALGADLGVLVTEVGMTLVP
ncbi:MAG: DUF1302 family protein, partial [Alphaproteobacteria bacterium]|nr:DUF1302 family protein [Alphaproteobacteria bacterium]